MGASASGSVSFGLPDMVRDPSFLLVTGDQKQSQWIAFHFMADPNGMSLSVMFRGDKCLVTMLNTSPSQGLL